MEKNIGRCQSGGTPPSHPTGRGPGRAFGRTHHHKPFRRVMLSNSKTVKTVLNLDNAEQPFMKPAWVGCISDTNINVSQYAMILDRSPHFKWRLSIRSMA